MYTILYILLLGIAGLLIYSGAKSKKRLAITGGAAIAILTIFFFWFMTFWGEKLWFEQSGYLDRFWTEWLTKLILFVVGLIIGFLVTSLLTLSLPKRKRYQRLIAVGFGALLSGIWWFGRWDLVLMFMNRVPSEITEPILNQHAGFYLFTLPFLNSLYLNILYLIIISLVANLVSVMQTSENERSIKFDIPGGSFISLFLSAGFLFLILGVGKYLNRFELLYSDLEGALEELSGKVQSRE